MRKNCTIAKLDKKCTITSIIPANIGWRILLFLLYKLHWSKMSGSNIKAPKTLNKYSFKNEGEKINIE